MGRNGPHVKQSVSMKAIRQLTVVGATQKRVERAVNIVSNIFIILAVTMGLRCFLMS
jgi:hypothetical protein